MEIIFRHSNLKNTSSYFLFEIKKILLFFFKTKTNLENFMFCFKIKNMKKKKSGFEN